MARHIGQVLGGIAGATALTFACAGTARADEGGDVKKLIKEEIKAYMDKKKEEDTKDMVFKAKWKDGLSFETPDKKYSMKIGGRIHLDTVLTDADEALDGSPKPGGLGLGADFDDATYFRRARLYVSGDITPYVDYKLQLDFADPSDGQLRDAYVTIKNLKDCVGCWAPMIRVGHQHEPMGLETMSTSNVNSFIERSLTTTLHADRQIGINFIDSFWKDRATAQLGFFSTDQDDDLDGFAIWDQGDSDGGYAVSGRFTLIPWAQDTCRFLHLGASGSYREGNTVRYQARPGLGRGPRVVDTTVLGPADLEEQLILNAELALVWNSFHASAEYTIADISSPTRGDPSFTAWYVQAGWFLSGEAKAYDFKKGLWGNSKPCCNFLSNECCCWGAFELVARYDTIDLNDGTILGGEMTNITAGLNWYLNPNMRIMFNAIFSTVENRSSDGVTFVPERDVTSFLMRWDVHF